MVLVLVLSSSNSASIRRSAAPSSGLHHHVEGEDRKLGLLGELLHVAHPPPATSKFYAALYRATWTELQRVTLCPYPEQP